MGNICKCNGDGVQYIPDIQQSKQNDISTGLGQTHQIKTKIQYPEIERQIISEESQIHINNNSLNQSDQQKVSNPFSVLNSMQQQMIQNKNIKTGNNILSSNQSQGSNSRNNNQDTDLLQVQSNLLRSQYLDQQPNSQYLESQNNLLSTNILQ